MSGMKNVAHTELKEEIKSLRAMLLERDSAIAARDKQIVLLLDTREKLLRKPETSICEIYTQLLEIKTHIPHERV